MCINVLKVVDVTVVVTVYNIDKYIGECLDSILKHNNIELEVICVDDASTDKSLDILKEYERKDYRVRIVCNKKNMGQASSRNVGCKVAKGKYLYVIDGDDYLVEDSLTKMVDIAEKNQLDLLTFDACSFWDEYSEEAKDDYQLYIRKRKYEGVYSGPKLFSQFVLNNDILGNICLNFYRKDFFENENLYWTEGARFNEDSPFAIYMAAKRAMCVQQIFYMRRRHMGSITTSPMKIEYQKGQMIQFLSELKIWNQYIFDEEIDASIELYFRRFHCEIKKVYRLSEDKDKDIPIINENKMANYIYKFFFLNMPLRMDMFTNEQISKIKKAENVVIYGAGNIAYEVAEILLYYKIDDYLIAVTKKENEEQKFCNKKIYEIEDLGLIKENSILIIAVTQRYSEDMYNYAINLGFQNLIKLKNV